MHSTSSNAPVLELQEPHWVNRAAFPLVAALFFLTQAALGAALLWGSLWLAIPLMLIESHLMHGLLIGFHEASHGMLRKSRRLNDIDGVILGALSFMSFTLYRAAHQLHHAHLASERDEELWPFVLPGTPRWQRLLAAFVELNAGILFTPFLFLRIFLRAGSPVRSPKVRRRVWAELALIVVVWSILLTTVALTNTWKYFLWMYAAPAIIAGNLQSWRKYIEHVGLAGSTVTSSTRSIVAEGLPGRVIAFTLLHEPYHGVHHLHSGLSHAELPQFASELAPKSAEEVSPFPSYTHALIHLLRNLPDPRAGAQWQPSTPL